MNAPEHIAPPANATAVALLPIAGIVASGSNPRKHFDDAYIAELADLEDAIRTHLDTSYTLPDEFDDADEIPRAIGILRRSPPARVVAMLLDDLVRSNECHVNEWRLDEDQHGQSAPHILAPLTRLVGVPFQSLTHPAATPSEAAPAADKGAKAAPAAEKPVKKPAAKKAKAKADPAPASPANEAAAPPKTTERPAWPFPIQKGGA